MCIQRFEFSAVDVNEGLNASEIGVNTDYTVALGITRTLPPSMVTLLNNTLPTETNDLRLIADV